MEQRYFCTKFARKATLFFYKCCLLFLFSTLLMTARTLGQSQNDSLTEQVSIMNDRLNGLDERAMLLETDVEKVNKLKISGYIQGQWEHFENPSIYPNNYFSIRRARVEFTYKPIDGVAFVLEPDFIPSGVMIKDAYAQLNEPWLNVFSLWVGQFNRPNYEVEYSSSKRELPERSRIIRTLYPGERAIGAKLEYNPLSIPLKVQLALFNGNDFVTSIVDVNGGNASPSNRDFDNYKDLMARITYPFRLGNIGSLDVGTHGYFGGYRAMTEEVLNAGYELEETVERGDKINRNWTGLEAQIYLDLWGGMAIKGEYLWGKNAFPGYEGSSTSSSSKTEINNDTIFITNTTTATRTIRPNIVRDFSGYYVYLIKNIGKKNQFAFRYDYFDPNTDIASEEIGVRKYDVSTSESSAVTETAGNTVLTTVTNNVLNEAFKSGTSDLAYGTLTFGWNYYFNDNIRIMLAYEIPMNEKVGKNNEGTGNLTSTYTVNGNKGMLDYSEVFPQNVLTLRFQAKF